MNVKCSRLPVVGSGLEETEELSDVAAHPKAPWKSKHANNTQINTLFAPNVHLWGIKETQNSTNNSSNNKTSREARLPSTLSSATRQLFAQIVSKAVYYLTAIRRRSGRWTSRVGRLRRYAGAGLRNASVSGILFPAISSLDSVWKSKQHDLSVEFASSQAGTKSETQSVSYPTL